MFPIPCPLEFIQTNFEGPLAKELIYRLKVLIGGDKRGQNQPFAEGKPTVPKRGAPYLALGRTP
jgi:hypothetical protein